MRHKYTCVSDVSYATNYTLYIDGMPPPDIPSDVIIRYLLQALEHSSIESKLFLFPRHPLYNMGRQDDVCLSYVYLVNKDEHWSPGCQIFLHRSSSPSGSENKINTSLSE